MHRILNILCVVRRSLRGDQEERSYLIVLFSRERKNSFVRFLINKKKKKREFGINVVVTMDIMEIGRVVCYNKR